MRFSQDELREAFDYVEDSKHWKNPFVALVPSDMIDVVRQAAIFFAGSPIEVYPTDDPDTFVVEGPGYYICIGA